MTVKMDSGVTTCHYILVEFLYMLLVSTKAREAAQILDEGNLHLAHFNPQ